MTEQPPRSGGSRRTPRPLLVSLWILGALIVLATGILLARRPLSDLLARRAAAASSSGDAEAAVRNIRWALFLAPRDLRMDILYWKYQYLEDTGDLEGAISDLRLMIEQDPGWRHGNSYVARAVLLIQLKRWDEAIADFQAAAAYPLPRAFIDFQLGRCQEGKGDLVAAKRSYQDAEAAEHSFWSPPAREALKRLP
jgi:tetratricopeptide (TPR) repeat protein